jgi:DNA (cytosine-5)-methyltransferase 1
VLNIATNNAAETNHAAGKTHRVLELFAGVGGFRFGLEQVNEERVAQGLPPAYNFVWANQWEPSSKTQDAARVYAARWGLAPVNRNLFDVLDDGDEMARISALSPTMLVGGFPCQDYSVAKLAAQSEGLNGSKGALWWGVHRLLQMRREAGQPVELLMLENVDRLVSSGKGCKGRDFAIILSSLQGLGYAVAWHVINAAEYGYAQRRRRVFMVAVHRSTPDWGAWAEGLIEPAPWLARRSPLAGKFPVQLEAGVSTFHLDVDYEEAERTYSAAIGGKTRFGAVGVCLGGTVWTARAKAASIADYTEYVDQAAPLTLGDVVGATDSVPESFYLPDSTLPRWQEAKGAKAKERVRSDGAAWTYREGAVAFPDPLDRPSRTVITSEGGRAATRTKHAVRAADGRLRRLTPDELDQLNGFPRGFTSLNGVSDAKRAFLMGNALVVGIVARIGASLAESADSVAQAHAAIERAAASAGAGQPALSCLQDASCGCAHVQAAGAELRTASAISLSSWPDGLPHPLTPQEHAERSRPLVAVCSDDARGEVVQPVDALGLARPNRDSRPAQPFEGGPSLGTARDLCPGPCGPQRRRSMRARWQSDGGDADARSTR